MRLDDITSDSACAALRAVRYAKPLDRSPLLAMSALSLRLKAEGIADTPQARAWELGRLLDQTARDELDRLRGASGGRPADTAEAERARLAADFRAGNIELEAWSMLFHRYLAVDRTPYGEVADMLGIVYKTLHRRLERGHFLLAERLRALEVEARARVMSRPGAPVRERVLVTPGATSPGAPSAADTMARVLDAVRSDSAVLEIAPGEAEALARHPVADLIEYRLGRIAEWSHERYRLDDRFVSLTLLMDQGEEARAGRWSPLEKRYSDLRAVLAETPDPALVLLGPPGTGKSTLLRRLELDLAGEGLRDSGVSLTFLVPLNRFPAAGRTSPREWLISRWAERFPAMPPLETAFAECGGLLLLDGLNEVPHSTFAEYHESVGAWKDFLLSLVAESGNTKVVFSCRSLDYSTPLSTPQLRVPQVRIEPMSDGQVKQFLEAYHPAMAGPLWARLAGTPQLEVMRVAYFARMLVEQADSDEVAAGPAALFTGIVRRALRREIERGSPLFVPDGVLAERDYKRATAARRWRTPHELPERGPLFRDLAHLAYAMQAGAASPEPTQARLLYDEALAVVDQFAGERVLAAGVQLGILDEDRDRDEVLFFHQLLQEYFAARALAAAPEPERVATAWRVEEVAPPLDELIDSLVPADPLPPLPQTGWEETTLLAAAMAPDPGSFVRALAPRNLALAGRAAAQPELARSLDPALVAELRAALVARSRDPGADLRDRIACGFALGDLGDPRFERLRGPEGDFLLPPLVRVPAGTYPIGGDEPVVVPEGSWSDHCPGHTVELASFQIGRFPVTNAEYALFVSSGGYDDERWWVAPADRDWRRGVNTASGVHIGVRWLVARCRARPAMMDELRAAGSWDQETYERALRRAAMSPAELDAHLNETYPGGRYAEPAMWRDERFNRPAQPVVGLSWFEARAYAAWLAAQSGLPFALPTEVEWEAAARGPEGRMYAFGDRFDRLQANTVEAHVRRTTPVGIYPAGDTPEGAADMTGNCWEWTSSAFGADPDTTEFPYPYVTTDGREADDLPVTVARASRGGSWGDNAVNALAYMRDYGFPDNRWRGNSAGGLRLVLRDTG